MYYSYLKLTNYTIKVTGFVKRSLIHAIINLYKYNFEIFNSIAIAREWLELPVHVSPQIYSYSKLFIVSTEHCMDS